MDEIIELSYHQPIRETDDDRAWSAWWNHVKKCGQCRDAISNFDGMGDSCNLGEALYKEFKGVRMRARKQKENEKRIKEWKKS